MGMPNFMTVQEFASKLACSEETVRRLIREGKLPAIRIGRDYRIEEKAVFVLSRTAQNSKIYSGETQADIKTFNNSRR